jgi:uncharacterized membrane protein YtjA (UPF0391 family)
MPMWPIVYIVLAVLTACIAFGGFWSDVGWASLTAFSLILFLRILYLLITCLRLQ